MIKTILKNSIFYTISFFFILILVSKQSFGNHEILNKKISIHIENQTIPEIINTIEKKIDVRFFYSADVFDVTKKYSFQYTNVTLGFVISNFISTDDVLLHIIDNTIIFYKKTGLPPDNKGKNYQLPNYKEKQEPHSSRTLLVDTLKQIIYDSITIRKIDTIIITQYDTIQVNIVNPNKKNIEKSTLLYTHIGYALFSQKFGAENGMIDSLYNESVDFNPQSLLLETGLGLKYNSFTISSGILFHSVQKNVLFDYTYYYTDTTEIIGYIQKGPPEGVPGAGDKGSNEPIYKIDTINVYNKDILTSTYLSLPLDINYSYALSPKIAVSSDVGLLYSILIHSNGTSINSEHSMVPINDLLNRSYLSAHANFGITYTIQSRHSVNFRYGLQRSLTNLFTQNSTFTLSEYAHCATLAYSYTFQNHIFSKK
ncbi:MAG: hypothetical protein PF481_00150 [Bacteroidales bacterium]|jgi:hypothetical protein|nr:hypothetical protein [Bacteroidales bacterium]